MLALPLQLFLIGKVLILAAATGAKERAFGCDSVRRGLQDFNEVGMRAIGVVAINACFDRLSRKTERHKDDPRTLLCRGVWQIDTGDSDS